jgi:hypothetical protein
VAVRTNLPPLVIHTLSSHGPVAVTSVGNGTTSQLHCAPFEEKVYLFCVAGSAVEEGLLMHAGLSLNAKASDGRYTLRMSGRAHAGRLLSGHRERASLEAWAPEGIPYSRLLVIPFAAEDVDLYQAEGDESARFTGRTPVGITLESAAREYTRAALSGLALPMVIWTTLITVAWLIVQGVRFEGREIAMGLALVGGTGMITGFRLIYVSIAFGQWRRGLARVEDAPVLSEGLLAPGQTMRMAAILLGFSALALISLALLWGSTIVGLVLGVSGVWLIVPAWALHLLMRQPEAHK